MRGVSAWAFLVLTSLVASAAAQAPDRHDAEPPARTEGPAPDGQANSTPANATAPVARARGPGEAGASIDEPGRVAALPPASGSASDARRQADGVDAPGHALPTWAVAVLALVALVILLVLPALMVARRSVEVVHRVDARDDGRWRRDWVRWP